ncbi:MAG: methyltransferase domain-containing protein [Myxococcota bacterium]
MNLLAGRRLPPLAGDDKPMLEARRRFLDGENYAPLTEDLNVLVHELLAEGVSSPCIVDAGCGEGHHLAAVARSLSSIGPVAFGTDISKEATRLAAKRHRDLRFLVADTHAKLPFLNESVHVLLNLFAARNPAEFARVVVPQGHLVVVMPAPEHLTELRTRFGLLGIAPRKQERLQAELSEWFVPYAERSCTFRLKLVGEVLRDLVAMTPSARHLDEEARMAIAHSEALEITASFRLCVFLRHSR